jgi:hypothetical protein
MFSTFAHSAVDAVQSTKKQVVNIAVPHEGIRNALNSFVDAQADYTKRAIDAGILASSTIGMIVSSKDFFDYTTNYFKSSVKGK